MKNNKNKTAIDIYYGRIRNKFFDKNLIKIKSMFGSLDFYKIINIIEIFLSYSDAKKEIIWDLVYVNELMNFHELIYYMDNDKDFLKNLSLKKIKNEHLYKFKKMIIPWIPLKDFVNFVSKCKKKYGLEFMYYYKNNEFNDVISYNEIECNMLSFFNKPLTHPVDLSSFNQGSSNIVIEELVTIKQLRYHAKLAQNCLSNIEFFRRIMNNESRVFHLKDKLRNVNNYCSIQSVGNKVIIKEIKGMFNTEYDKDCFRVAVELTNYINSSNPNLLNHYKSGFLNTLYIDDEYVRNFSFELIFPRLGRINSETEKKLMRLWSKPNSLILNNTDNKIKENKKRYLFD